ncbi:MAG TPA: hypothetical protein VKA23_02090 [Mariprofundaceae bacterium]|nr:hypothetical protein [Mariprofundaceae bacterium]
MFLDKYLTIYDDRLTGESYIDPIGTLIIWSAYGQKIFNNRVNSISNDVRNYTLNLFNHYLIRRLIRDESFQLGSRLLSLYGSKNTLQFKYACLLYLENMFVYSILKHDGDKGVDSTGVLGITNGRRHWSGTNPNPKLVFSNEKDGQLLVRQLSLGVSGRYKTPFMGIGYFDGNYQYDIPDSGPIWEGVEALIAGSPQLGQLSEAVCDHLKFVLGQNSAKPQISFNDVPEALHKAYAKTFASSGFVGKFSRSYWLAATRLDTGAAGALLQVLDENAESGKPVELSAQRLTELTPKKDLQPEEREKIEHIELLEPFLADVMLLFFLLTTKKSQPLTSVIAEWMKLGRDEDTLRSRAQRVRSNQNLLNVLKGSALWRLQTMLHLADAPTLLDQITLLVDYHGKVMTGRAQSSWLNIDDNLVKVHVRPSRPPAEKDWPNGTWYNNYYLPQFQWLVSGYQGGGV